MFGLENISHWQFVVTMLLCLLNYYLILLMYLALKKINGKEASSFEHEALQEDTPIQAKAIRATDFPSAAIRHAEADESILKVSMDQEPDYSGYVMEALQDTLMEDKETFLNNIEYELQQS
jgi:Tfp pilus assembly protein PilO